MDGKLSHLEELLEAKNIFVKNRKQRRNFYLGILLYHFELSLRKCRNIVSSYENISHEAIRKWYHKIDTIFTVHRTYQEVVAVDETKVKTNGTLYSLWVSLDICSWEILGVWVIKGRASFET